MPTGHTNVLRNAGAGRVGNLYVKQDDLLVAEVTKEGQGQDIICRFAVKPTSSILILQKTIDLKKNNTEITTKGRHDPCVGIRAVPIGEAMAACILADHKLRHRAQCGE